MSGTTELTWKERLELAATGQVLGKNEIPEAQPDPRAYYATLAEQWTEYAPLALGVVERNTFSGLVANYFAANKIINPKDLGQTASEQQWRELQVRLMQSDYELRAAQIPPFSSELEGSDISEYHDNAFRQVFGAPAGGSPRAPKAWTPYYLYQSE